MKRNVEKQRHATMQINYNKKNITLSIKQLSLFGKFFGLMFRTPKTENLLFSFPRDTKKAFHSLFVFFPFLMLWLDKKKKVTDWRLVKPFSTVILAKKKFRYVVEIPLNQKNKRIVEFFVERGKV